MYLIDTQLFEWVISAWFDYYCDAWGEKGSSSLFCCLNLRMDTKGFGTKRLVINWEIGCCC